MRRPDRVRVTTFVDVSPDDAFDVFTQETDLWWRRGPRFRSGPKGGGVLRFEGGAGGRLVETSPERTHEVGRVLVWERGARLVFEWRGSNFAIDEKTEVEIRFEPKNGGTEVVLEHRGWASLRDDHPARHGLDGAGFTSMIGRWWGDLATSFRMHAVSR